MPKEILIADKSGREVERRIVAPKENIIFENKKIPIVDEESILEHLSQARKLYKENEVGQREATVEVHPQHPNLPIGVWLLNDFHAGSVFTDYERFLKDYKIVSETPNLYTITNGDLPDNFLVDTAQAAGVYEDTITPEQQGLLVRGLMRKLAEREKLLASSFGNHEDFTQRGGISFEGTWLRDLPCPVFNCGGLLTLKYNEQEYKIATTHRFWGHSRLNPTNACKRFMEHVYPEADVSYLGHSHIREHLSFYRGGKNRLAIVGGCYKIDDEFGLKRGMGAGGQQGGLCLMLRGDKKEMFVMESVEEAREYLEVLKDVKNKT